MNRRKLWHRRLTACLERLLRRLAEWPRSARLLAVEAALGEARDIGRRCVEVDDVVGASLSIRVRRTIKGMYWDWIVKMTPFGCQEAPDGSAA